MVRVVLLLGLLTACTIPLEPVGPLAVSVSDFPNEVLPGDALSVTIATDAYALEVAVTLPEGVQVSERIEGARAVLDVTVDGDAEPGVRVITVYLRDGVRSAEVALGLKVEGAG